MRKPINFNSGPSMLPEIVLHQAQDELLNWHNTGVSVMEMGHREENFQAIAQQAQDDLRELLAIPEHYHILFIPGGASAQFAMVPLNLLAENGQADYIDSGIWSKKATQEARRYTTVTIAAKLEQKNGLSFMPPAQLWSLNKNAAYIHLTPNETIEGIAYPWLGQTADIPIIADMTSLLLSGPIDVNKYGIIYAAAQKNMGIAGITIVIIRDDLIKSPKLLTPTLYQYKTYADHASIYNTPPTFNWYVSGLMFTWLKQQGGVAKLYAINQQKARVLYQFIDKHNDFYANFVYPECRSMTNVVFTLHKAHLINDFITAAAKVGLINLAGHRAVGGLRVSMYNAMPQEAVAKLIEFMAEFKSHHC